MAITLKAYTDSGMTALAANVAAVQANDGSSPAVDRVLYLGSTTASKKFQAFNNPGVDAIVLTLVDTAVGSGVEAVHIKMALTNAGLAGATAGAPLSLGTQILSGAGNAVAVHLRIDTPALADGTYTDLSLSTNPLVEVAA